MSCDPSKTCSVCDQKGLPILPLRYAVARSDKTVRERAPQLQAPFGAGITDIPLPGDHAAYTLRMLRPGYLYVFNEARGEWKAYVVNDDSYLMEFPVHSKSPPIICDAEPCSRMQSSASGRCIMIPDAGKASTVWLGFSDTAWTPAVLERHRSESYRKRHMQRIDVAAWAKGKKSPATQPHVQRLDKLTQLIAEFALKAPEQTQLTPWEIAAHKAKNACSPENKRSVLLQLLTLKGYPAVAYSSHHYNNAQLAAAPLLDAATAAAGSLTPAMVAVNDPVGVTMEISELIRAHIRAFEARDDRGWKKATSVAIQGLREAIQANAADQALARHSAQRYQRDEFGIPFYPEYTEAQRKNLDRMFGSLSPEADKVARENAWKRYTDDYSESKRVQFDRQLSIDFEALVNNIISKLARPFVAWYQSSRFRNAIECTHDECDIASGQNLTAIVATCLAEIMGLPSVTKAVLKDLSGLYSELDNPTMRALVLNNTKAADILDSAASPELEIGNPTAWARVLKAFSHVIEGAGKTNSKEELSLALGSVGKLAYQISGPVVLALGRAGRSVADSASNIAVGIGTRYRMMAMLGVISGRPLRILQINATDRELGHALVEALADGQKGIDKNKLRQQVDADLADARSDSGSRTSTDGRNARGRKKFSWTVFWDDASRKALGNGVDPARLGDTVLSQRQLQSIVRSRAGSFVKVDIGMGAAALILDGWNAYGAFEKLDNEKAGTAGQRQLGLATALVGMTGSSAELVGAVVQRAQWGSTRLARPFAFFANRVTTRAALIGFGGRLLGAIGGFLSGALDLWRAVEARERGDLPSMYLLITTGSATIVVAALMFFGVVSLGVGFVIMIVLALLALLGEWLIGLFTDNDVEKWIDKTPFGKNKTGRFDSHEAQVAGWNAVMGGAAN